MEADLYSEAIEYEQLTQVVYQAILQKEGVVNVKVEHNVSVVGRSGVSHQIDVLWRFKQAGIEHAVMIECKNYAASLTVKKSETSSRLFTMSEMHKGSWSRRLAISLEQLTLQSITALA